MDLRWRTFRLAVWLWFMSLQLGSGSPFFGVSVQGGFQAEADISVAARALRSVADSSRESMLTFTTKLPLNTALHNVAGGAVVQLYSLTITNVISFTDRLSWAAINTTNPPAEVFSALTTAYNSIVTKVQEEAPAAIASITSYSSANGATISRSKDNILLILSDILKSINTFKGAIDTFPSPITAKQIFEKLSKSQIATIVGALDALKAELSIVSGKLKETTTTLLESDALISNYINLLSQSFENIDFSLSNLFTRLSSLSADFEKQFQAADITVTKDVQTFNAKITPFRDNIIAPVANEILVNTTRPFSEKYSEAYTIFKPNVEEKLQLLVGIFTDRVLNAAQNLLFTTYQVLDSVMRRIPNVPTQGKPCATEFINPYVHYLSSNMASSLSSCISSTAAQVESVLRGQLQAINALVKDRQAYFKMWNDAINGVSNNSDAATRIIAAAKLTARTTSQALDTQQPMLASFFSNFAQLVSNLDAVLNRSKLCVTLKSAELSSQLVMASTSFNTCMDS